MDCHHGKRSSSQYDKIENSLMDVKVVEYFAYTLLTGYASNTAIKSFVDKYDFYIFPVVNPDGEFGSFRHPKSTLYLTKYVGFIYSQTSDRMWRKNRQSTSGSSCLGHDINRNWPFKWDVTGGASTNPCAEDFKGTSAGDAPETKVLYSYTQGLKNAQGLKLFIDYHSYSQLFMTRTFSLLHMDLAFFFFFTLGLAS
jgi:murein tripeptide amidase MpaA